MNARALWQRLKSIRHVEWIVLLIVVGIAGSVLMQEGAPLQSSNTTDLEKRLAHVLSAVEGAGRVEVIVHTLAEEPAQTVGAFGTVSAQKAGEKPSGVIVVAEGAERLQVRLDLARAVQTLLGLPASAVEVLPKQKPP